jgi:DNA-binding phage protein
MISDKKTQEAAMQKQKKSQLRAKKAPETTAWDPSEHLSTPNAIAAYLEAAFEDGDAALIAAAVDDVARAQARG